MLHKLRTLNPYKLCLEASTAGNRVTCNGCAQGPWLAMNSLADVARVLVTRANEVQVPPALGLCARRPINCMLAFTAALKRGVAPGSLVNWIRTV